MLYFFMFFSRKKSKSRKKGEKRIFNAAEEYGLPKPSFQEFDNMFRVELFRNNSMTESEKKFGVNSEKRRSKDGAGWGRG